MKSRIDSNSATEYGEVETLEVKESTRIQHTTEQKGKDQITYPYRYSVELRAALSAPPLGIYEWAGRGKSDKVTNAPFVRIGIVNMKTMSKSHQ